MEINAGIGYHDDGYEGGEVSAHSQGMGTEQGQVTLGYLEIIISMSYGPRSLSKVKVRYYIGFWMSFDCIAWYMVMSLMTYI